MNSILALLISIFLTTIKSKRPDIKGFNLKHCGKEGHWAEKCFGKNPDNYNRADAFGYEIKLEGSKITFGDWKANYTIYEDPVYAHLFNNYNAFWTPQDCFCYYFGKPSTRVKNRYSWSGKPVPRFGNKFNSYGQAMMTDINGNIIVIYSYSYDMRENKTAIVPHEFWQDNLILMKWYVYSSPDEKKACLRERFENKFSQQGTLILQKNKSGIVDKLKICGPVKFDDFMTNLKNNVIILDCGMYQGNNRSYHKWRAPKKFWDDYVIETIT